MGSRWGAGIEALVLSFAACGVLVACHSDCQSNADCGAGESCIFPVSDGCSAKGKCEAPSPASCGLGTQYCGCDGSVVPVGCDFTGAPAPVAGPYSDSCPRGTKDAGGACVVNADCGLGQGCFYAIADGCSATGTCLENTAGGSNGCENTPVYCGCDAGRPESVCFGHDGYVGAPVSRTVEQEAQCSMPDSGPILIVLPDAGAH